MTDAFNLYCFESLSNKLLYDILALRAEVFVVEQDSAYQDIDGIDPAALHLCLTASGALTGYARILPPGVKFAEASVGRVVIAQAHRGKGLGRNLMRRGMREAQARFPGAGIRIEAQYHLRDFYQSLGFTVASEIYDWGGIEHVKMVAKTA